MIVKCCSLVIKALFISSPPLPPLPPASSTHSPAGSMRACTTMQSTSTCRTQRTCRRRSNRTSSQTLQRYHPPRRRCSLAPILHAGLADGSKLFLCLDSLRLTVAGRGGHLGGALPLPAGRWSRVPAEQHYSRPANSESTRPVRQRGGVTHRFHSCCIYSSHFELCALLVAFNNVLIYFNKMSLFLLLSTSSWLFSRLH